MPTWGGIVLGRGRLVDLEVALHGLQHPRCKRCHGAWHALRRRCAYRRAALVAQQRLLVMDDTGMAARASRLADRWLVNTRQTVAISCCCCFGVLLLLMVRATARSRPVIRSAIRLRDVTAMTRPRLLECGHQRRRANRKYARGSSYRSQKPTVVRPLATLKGGCYASPCKAPGIDGAHTHRSATTGSTQSNAMGGCASKSEGAAGGQPAGGVSASCWRHETRGSRRWRATRGHARRVHTPRPP